MKTLLTSHNKRCADEEYRPERRLSLCGKCENVGRLLDNLRRQCGNMPIGRMSLKTVTAALRRAETEQENLSEDLCGL